MKNAYLEGQVTSGKHYKGSEAMYGSTAEKGAHNTNQIRISSISTQHPAVCSFDNGQRGRVLLK